MSNDFTMYEGESRALRVTVHTAEGKPFSIENTALTFSLAKRPEGEAYRMLLSAEGDIVMVDAAKGIFDVRLKPEHTQGDIGRRFYEVQVAKGADRWTVATGEVEIRPSMIR